MQPSVKNRTIFCHDNLPILRGINSESIDLIYLDPPFNKGRQFHAPIGSTAEGADFKDIWSSDDVKDEWHNQINDKHPKLYKYLDATGDIGSRPAKYYLIYIAIRLIEMHRILKPTGSIYLHCDPTASHYLKLLMDTIWGHQHISNEIIWSYRTGGVSKKWWPRKHDVLLFYANSKYKHNPIQEKIEYKKPFFGSKIDEMGIPYADVYIRDVWEDIKPLINMSKERTGYPTQKPLTLLERIIQASSNEGDVVLDPFCGCATACVASERLNRQWIGIDVSSKAYDLVQQRLRDEVLEDNTKGVKRNRVSDLLIDTYYRLDIPARTDRNGKKKPTKEDKYHLYGKQNGFCAGCTTYFEIQHLEVDHIIPQNEGGWHNIENLQLLCSHCNRLKGDKPMEYLHAKLKALYGRESI